jgi:ubiquinone/menaquinone biosynthesis C-methylase UbiE
VYSVALAKRGYVVEAVDTSPGMLERTRRHAGEAQVGDRVRATMGDVYHLAFHDEAFPVVLVIGLMSWVDSAQKAIGELARIIKPGGYLLLTVENSRRLEILLDPLTSPAFSLARRMVKSIFRVSWWPPAPVDAVWNYRHSVQDMDELLAPAELRRVHAETLGFGPFTFFDHQFLPDWFGVKVNRVLQYLANLGCPGLRSTGSVLVVLARK